jgi:hypothetical protein
MRGGETTRSRFKGLSVFRSRRHSRPALGKSSLRTRQLQPPLEFQAVEVVEELNPEKHFYRLNLDIGVRSSRFCYLCIANDEPIAGGNWHSIKALRASRQGQQTEGKRPRVTI